MHAKGERHEGAPNCDKLFIPTRGRDEKFSRVVHYTGIRCEDARQVKDDKRRKRCLFHHNLAMGAHALGGGEGHYIHALGQMVQRDALLCAVHAFDST